jgi:hypothetical protein
MITEKSIRESIEASGVNVVKEAGFVSIKSASDTIVSPAPGVIQFAERDGGAPRPLRVRDLIPTVQATSGSVGFFTTTREGSPAYVAEDGAKPQMSFASELVTRPLINFAGITKVTEECASDYPALVDHFQNSADEALNDIIDTQIITGNGSTGQLSGLNREISGSTVSIGLAIADLIRAGYTPNGIMMRRDIFAALIETPFTGYRIVPEGSSLPIGEAFALIADPSSGSGFAGPSGLLEFSPLRFMGLPIAIMPMTSGGPSIIVGDFRRATRLYTHGIERQIGRDDNDFSHDRLTLRSSERVALAVIDAGGLRKASLM